MAESEPLLSRARGSRGRDCPAGSHACVQVGPGERPPGPGTGSRGAGAWGARGPRRSLRSLRARPAWPPRSERARAARGARPASFRKAGRCARRPGRGAELGTRATVRRCGVVPALDQPGGAHGAAPVQSARGGQPAAAPGVPGGPRPRPSRASLW